MKTIFSLLVFTVFCLKANGQSVGINTTTPDVNAILDIYSTDKGILIPRISQAARNNMKSVTAGMMVYDTDHNMFFCYNGNAWVELSTVGVFENNNGVVRNSGSTDDDFVFGMYVLPDNTTKYTENLFFFDEEKGAFRAGRLNNSRNWAPDSIGFNSFAAGYNSKAKGQSSVSIGYDNKANAPYGIAIGFGNEAEGDFSTAMGLGTDAESYAGMSIGRLNVGGGDRENWVLTDPVFEIGIGTNSATDRRNAMTVLKNGKTGIGTATPDTTLSVVGVARAAFDESETDYIEMSHGGANAFINAAGSGNLDIRHDGNNVMTITPSRVGVGTNSPDTDFSVIGKVRAAIQSNENEYTEIFHGGDNGYINTVGDGDLQFRHDNNTLMSLNDGGDLYVDGQLTLGNANVNTDYTFPSADGNTDQYLRTDGNGNLSWKSIIHSPFATIGQNIVPVLTTNNFFIGGGTVPQMNSTAKMIYYNNDQNALRHGYINQSDDWDISNLGLGSFATGYNVMASGNYSVAIGDRNDATGEDSFASGENTLASGLRSAAFGDESEATGENAFATGWVGRAAGKNSFKAGWSNFSNGENSTTMGALNTAHGYGSLATGSGSVVNSDVGSALGVGLLNNSYGNVVLGAFNLGVGSNPGSWVFSNNEPILEIGIGNAATRRNALTVTKTGTVGIGNSASQAMLTIDNHNPDVINPRGFLSIQENGNPVLTVGPAGNLIVKNDIRIDGTIEMLPANGVVTHKIKVPNSSLQHVGLAIAYGWVTYSDQRVKKEVEEIPYGLKEIMALRPVKYNHHSSDIKDVTKPIDEYKEEIGFIAQEVHPVINEVVYQPEDESKSLWSMDYERLTPVLVKAVQEQQAIIESLQQQLSEKESEMKSLKSDVDKLFKMIKGSN